MSLVPKESIALAYTGVPKRIYQNSIKSAFVEGSLYDISRYVGRNLCISIILKITSRQARLVQRVHCSGMGNSSRHFTPAFKDPICKEILPYRGVKLVVSGYRVPVCFEQCSYINVNFSFCLENYDFISLEPSPQ